ncbi:type VI secretion system baseplate subunit TssF [Swingsia samuiensis]|uniref:Type VI secretion system baseplate subunit TssF n=1 Tax=Swingsia samuiensis TaxID=1293412 RepID=A0A4Y6UIX3_9PROT|nr:type VI secretion system baseplate subunit TssF [Swingsia samuiensis]QDH16331.1 type VI secretion system baseplate subunit TssF [Swingsia samuiensis]
MADDFINAYQRELDALRTLAGTFAQAHPKVAGRLRLSRDTIDDPHVERLLEGVAFLTGRVQQRLDDEYPELTDTLLDILYPHYLAPLPSACLVQFEGMPDARTSIPVPLNSPLQTSLPNGTTCRFRTTAPADIWPIHAHSARMQAAPFDAPNHPASRQAQSILSVRLSLSNPDAKFLDVAPESLKFFIQAPHEQSSALYELLCAHTVGIALASSPNDDRPTILSKDQMTSCGFDLDEALYPWPKRSFTGFRLLTEYFAFPEKFLGVVINGLDARTLVETKNELTLFIYFDTIIPSLVRTLHSNALRLNCVPIANLYESTCEPIRLNHWKTNYPVDPPRNGNSSAEIWHINSVSEIHPDGTTRPWQPLYRYLPNKEENIVGEYTLARRLSPIGKRVETYLTPIEFNWTEEESRNRLLSIDATLSDGDLPARLPFGGGAPHFMPERGLGSVTQILCLTPPTQGWRQRQRARSAWALITHLNLNHLSLTGGEDAASALRDLLTLYDVRNTEETRAAIASLVEVTSAPTVARLSDGLKLGWSRGLEVTLTFEAGAWSEHGLFLLASVLDRFFALHIAANNFVRTVVRLTTHPDPVASFAPRAGFRRIL